ncbi:MAG: HEPN domain-containing protein, partial [Nitrososphaerota archaeon]
MAVSEDLPSIEGVAGSLVELWQEFQKMLQNQNLEKQKENRDLAMEFLKCAKEDIEATKLLYEERLIPLSVYHLQQAVEKTTKAYALALSIVTIRELREIEHKSPLVFIKLLKKRWVVSYINLLKILYPQMIKDFDIDEVEKIIRNKQKELAEIPKNVTISYLTSIKEMRNDLPKIYLQVKKFVDLLKPLTNDQTENLKRALEATFSSGTVTSFISLYLLSVITYPHYIFTRYPDGEIKPSDYYS